MKTPMQHSQYRNIGGPPAEIAPKRKKPTRPAMSKKSPYKLPARTGKAAWKHRSAAKSLSLAKRFAGKNPSIGDNVKARTRQWAKSGLGRNKQSNPTQGDATQATDVDGKAKGPKTRSAGEVVANKNTHDLPDTLLGRSNNIFHDTNAWDTQGTRHDVAVEDISDEEEDDELCDLRSLRRNLAPSTGQWMEPL